jgi:peptide/nickel transport system ATP-binding protein
LKQIPGMAPSPIDLPPGCAFRERCPRASPACVQAPPMRTIGALERGRSVRCHFPLTALADAVR